MGWIVLWLKVRPIIKLELVHLFSINVTVIEPFDRHQMPCLQNAPVISWDQWVSLTCHIQ